MILVVYGILAAGLAVLSLEPPHVTPLWIMVILGLGALAALSVHRRYPAPAFVGAMVLAILSLGGGSGAESILALIAMYIAAVNHQAREAWICFGVAMGCGAIAALAWCIRSSVGPPILGLTPPVQPRDSLLDWTSVYAIIAALLLILTLLGTNVGHRRRHVGELVDRAERLARERDQQAEIARALERERIAREMHDVIAHSLSVMIAISDGAHAAADERPGEAKVAIARVAETGRRTLAEVRRLLGAVRGEAGGLAVEHSPQPDASQLPSLVTEFTAAGLPVRLEEAGTPPVDSTLGLTVYRIVQESLTNVLRHGRQVSLATVRVTWTADEVRILVRDDGSKVNYPHGAGRGILGMQERAALYDGILETGPNKDGGWQVMVQLRWVEN